MRNRRNAGHRPSRIERVERKCDRILSELKTIRGSLFIRSSSMDDAIERMHRNARRMRAEAAKEARILRNMLQLK